MVASLAKGRLWLAVALVVLVAGACAPTTKRFEIDPKLAEVEADNETLRELLQTEASAAHSFADKRDVAEAERDELRKEQRAMVCGQKDKPL